VTPQPPPMGHLYNVAAALSRPQRTADGQGGFTETFVPVGTVRGRVRSWTSEEELVARQLGVRISHVFYCDLTDVRRGDRLEVGTTVYDVRSVRQPSDPHHLMVDLEERQN
jgi:SPP1 family predicted phage head-tail adaptor